MSVLSGETAFGAIREALSGIKTPDSFSCEEIPFERLRLALIDVELSEFDRAVRLRHALRYASLSSPTPEMARTLPLPDMVGWPKPDKCVKFGLRVRAGGSVEALPWRPDWLPNIPDRGVDATPSQAPQRQWNNLAPTADPWLQSVLGFHEFRGPGQALAVRCALHIPNGSTLLVLLPTGEGKSLVFQALAAAHPKRTVAVVVPTVALALDHAIATRNFSVLHPEHPHAYVGGQDVNNATIRAAISNGEQGLVFAAPEAMVASLRQPLIDAARNGQLAALVIDEAHLVDAWGTDFRSEFQLLSALVAELRDVSPPHRQPVVVCLSATVTQEAMETLEALFSPNEPISLVPAARLRPEPDIWIAPVSNSKTERQQHVMEALCNLPRPAVLYVTEPTEANAWLNSLQQAGFARVRTVHGDTDTATRAQIIELWRKGELDLVVGTSAFGLGIDYSHVRTVIHACVPESLDRYYQEIGRSGRDNCASIALFLPAEYDFAVAESLSTKRIITIEKGLPRWGAMFKGAERDSSGALRYLVDPTVSPGYDPDMKSGRNEDWNGRVLNLMARSGLIRLSGLRYDYQSNRTRVAVDILDDGHAELTTWQARVGPVRKRLLDTYWGAFLGMRRLISDKSCPSLLFGKLYQLRHNQTDWPVVLACGGCAVCRTSYNEGWFAVWPNAPTAPWPIGRLNSRLKAYCDRGRCFIERDGDTFETKRQIRRLKDMVNALWDAGLRKCIVVGNIPQTFQEAIESRPWCVAHGQNDKVLGSNGLPPGPELVWIAEGGILIGSHHFNPLQEDNERIVLLPPNPSDPANPSRLLAERLPVLPFDKFYNWLQP